MEQSLRLLRQDRALTAISVLLDVAFHAGRGATGPVAGGAEVADRLGAARRGIEPVFQALSRAGLLEGVRGPRGGYRLARRPRDIRLSEAVAAVAEGTEGGSDLAGPLHEKVVGPLWAELDEALRERLEGLTLEDLLRRAGAAGLQRPATEPLNFTI
ncbi:RrF2 family transcriptional regulator [Muricoccus pecuniae]|uniref:Rrf2 family protein n=1 Tax=Muricoccus pecuniae TaxID=693023 RepID=A0A840YFK5_9PROT|nr:Rrf2 family transcriptional regulator [Roseomonas pecuniae]MBB5692683.1 Rrf2 family protein [Roseomonas pecuniae]